MPRGVIQERRDHQAANSKSSEIGIGNRRNKGLNSGKSTEKKEKSLRKSVKLVIASQDSLGNSYNYSLNFDHPSNQNVTERVKTDISYLNSKKDEGQNHAVYSMEYVTLSCKKYFTNQKKDHQRKVNGTFDKHRNICKSTQRKKKKLDERTLAAYNTRVNLTPEEREKAQFMMGCGADIISSDESESEGDSTDGRKRRKTVGQSRKVKEFYWASEQFMTIRDKLDDGYAEVLASARQRKLKTKDTLVRDSTCPISDRPPPSKEGCGWMLKLD